MSIFSKIRDAIFNRKPAASAGTGPSGAATGAAVGAAAGTAAGTATAGPAGTAPPVTSGTGMANTAGTAGSAATPAQAQPAPMQQVDVEAILTQLSSSAGQKLNWRTSIVDLMKLLGMESSLDERRELARELGYTGSTSDTATMNIWLHKQVMKKLAENGGKVPADLLD
ncbi:MAG TPA: DUF3597 domain-containing protein [Rubrivivax sp.]|nr:DUF3597 domain-containing protein [Rubrivivax sp.]